MTSCGSSYKSCNPCVGGGNWLNLANGIVNTVFNGINACRRPRVNINVCNYGASRFCGIPRRAHVHYNRSYRGSFCPPPRHFGFAGPRFHGSSFAPRANFCGNNGGFAAGFRAGLAAASRFGGQCFNGVGNQMNQFGNAFAGSGFPGAGFVGNAFNQFGNAMNQWGQGCNNFCQPQPVCHPICQPQPVCPPVCQPAQICQPQTNIINNNYFVNNTANNTTINNTSNCFPTTNNYNTTNNSFPQTNNYNTHNVSNCFPTTNYNTSNNVSNTIQRPLPQPCAPQPQPCAPARY